MIWRVILPVAALVTLANAGGRTLSAQESAQFLSLFRRYCSSPNSGPSQDGNTFYYCKTSDQGPQTLQISHEAEVSGGDTPKQVIFVQPPPTKYLHEVALRGNPGNPQQTEIYVLPQSADHELSLQDKRNLNVEAQKPSLYFLSGDQQQQQPGFGGGNRPGPSGPPPIRQPNPTSNFNNQRPSSPLPRPSQPAVIGIGTGLSSGGISDASGSQGGYSQAYGVPGLRNQRNVQQPRTNAYRTF